MVFLITALSVYGLASLITGYDGPKGMFLKLRNKYPYSAINCTVCLSCWIALPMILTGAYLGLAFLAPFAIVGVVILLERL